MASATAGSICATCRRRPGCIVGGAGALEAAGGSPVARVEVVEAGRGLAEPSGQGRLIGILRAGLLRLDSVDARGKRYILGLVLPGEPVGELLPMRSAHAVTALVTSRICRFHTDREMDFSNLSPQLRHDLLRAFSVRLARLQSLLWIRASLSVNARVAALLLMGARFMDVHALANGNALLTFALSRADAAELLSTTVESLCRALHALERDGLIELRDSHHFELRDVAALERRAALDGVYLDTLFPRRPIDTRSRNSDRAGASAGPGAGHARARASGRAEDATGGAR